MTFFCAHQPTAGTQADQLIESQKPCCERSPQDVTAVGTGLLDKNIAAVESELDRVIEQIGSRMVQAMRDGDPQGAEILRDRLYAAIGSRSPEHQQRLHAKAWQRMLDEDPCYFSAMGELDGGRTA
jgi:hypothetical protein